MVKRHPLLVARDKAYADAKRHPMLVGDNGDLAVDEMPLFTDLIGLRPLTLEEQVARFTQADLTDFNLVPDENFLSEDDFHDYLDDLPEDGFTPYEEAGFNNILAQHEMGRGYYAPPEPQDDFEADDPTLATPVAAPVAASPQTAKAAKGTASDASE